MPAFNVQVVTTIQIAANIDVTAKDEDAANEKVQAMIDKGKFAVSWNPPENSTIEFEESDNTTEIESCDKQ